MHSHGRASQNRYGTHDRLVNEEFVAEKQRTCGRIDVGLTAVLSAGEQAGRDPRRNEMPGPSLIHRGGGFHVESGSRLS